MSDIRTVFDKFDADWLVDGPSLAQDDGLETAVVISLFTDRRANDDDALPVAGDRRGWWGDTFAEVDGDRIGSRLWLLSREKQVSEVLVRAKQYAEESLQWLIEDGIARSVTVTPEIVTTGWLGLQIEIVRSARPVARYRFEAFWKGATNAV